MEEIEIPSAEETVEVVTEPAAEAAEDLERVSTSKIDELINLVTVNNDHLVRSQEAHERTLGRLAELSNTLAETAGHLATASAHVASESTQTVLTVPEVAGETADGVVEEVAEEAAGPKRRGNKQKFKRRK